jgi:hypothetical protein
MSMRILGLAVIASVTLLAGGGGHAWATTCSGEYNAANGTTSTPGTNIGTVAAGCEIGPFNATFGANGNAATVNTSGASPSIYEFTWTGGNLTIEEMLGNNGIGHNINVELGLATDTVNANGTLSSALYSTTIAYQSGPTTSPTYIIDDVDLAAGTYSLDTYLGTCATGDCSGGTSTDPQYQVLFSPVSATPLPAALPLFASGLGIVGFVARRRKRKDAAAVAAA